MHTKNVKNAPSGINKSIFGFFFEQGFNGFVRNKAMSIASILILISCMIVLGSFFLVTVNINDVLAETESLYILKVYISDSKSDEETASIGEQIKTFSNVDSVDFISSEEAFESVKDEIPDLDELIDGYNPMRRSFHVKFVDPKGVNVLSEKIKSIDGVEDINQKTDIYKSASDLKKTLTFVCVSMMAILLVVALLVIMNSIKITVFSRQEEIYIMRYIGATRAFISMPFVIEGVITGLVSAFLSFAIQFCLYKYVMISFVDKLFADGLVPFGTVWMYLFIGFIIVGLFAGAVASLVSLKKYLKK